MKATEVSIGELSKQSDVNIETIRYYEKIGVMPAPGRSAAGYRIYGADHLKRLSFVRRSRQLGFSLDEIRELLRLVDGHAYTCAEVQALTLNHLAEIRRKIADLKRLKRSWWKWLRSVVGRECPNARSLMRFLMRSRHPVSAKGSNRCPRGRAWRKALEASTPRGTACVDINAARL